MKIISNEDLVEHILRPHYWNRWQADRIVSQALANILVDWVWGSGRYGIAIPQSVLGVKADGIVGEETLGALNGHPDPEKLFGQIKQVRERYLRMIFERRPANRKFLKGWLSRLNDFKWIPMALLFCFMLSCRAVQKMETLDERQKVKGEWQRVKDERRTVNEEQEEQLSEAKNETLSSEEWTAIFDTLGSRRMLKELRLSRTISGKAVQTDKQTERRTAGAETVGERQKAKVESQTTIQAERKEKPSRNSWVWWIAGGAAVLLILALLKKYLILHSSKFTIS